MADPQPTEEQRKQWEEKIKNMSPEELKELQKQQCIFCQIISEKVPSKKIYDDPVCIVALDIAPAAPGHLLIVPKEHYMIMPQVPDQVLGHLIVIAKRLSQIILKVLRASGTTLFVANGGVAGQRSQHFFLHLIPRKEGDHVLDLHEKIISKELVEKVKLAVENKLFELMGVKKPVKEAENQERPEIAPKVDESPEEKIKSKPISVKKNKSKSNPKKTKKMKSAKTAESLDENQGTNTEVKLDDIANLFK